MPCVKGRAQHILCRPDCSGEDPCSCKVREAFSCREVCQEDDLINTQLTVPDARGMLCEYIDFINAGNTTLGPAYTTVGEFQNAICDQTGLAVPSFNCPFTVTVQAGSTGVTGTVGPFEVAVINRGMCSGGEPSQVLEVGGNSVYDVFVDHLQCNSFTNSST